MAEKFHTNNILGANCIEVAEGYKGIVDLKEFTVKFSIKNIIVSMADGEITIIIEPKEGVLSRPLNFHLKAFSDSNKEQLARLLKSSFSEFTTQWTLIVNEIVSVFIEALNSQKQNFVLSEVVGEKKGWLFEPFIMEHSINIFFGMGDAGKTFLALYLSVLYGLGKDLYKHPAKQGKTLLIDFENDQLEWRDRMKGILSKLPMDMEEADKTFHYWQTNQVALANQVEKLKTFIRENGISLIIVDSASMASGDSTSDEAATLRLMASLKLLNTTSVLIAHQRKNEGEENPIGSIQYFNQARNIWRVEGEPDDEDEHKIHLGCIHRKNNSGPKKKQPIGFEITFGEGFIDIVLENAIHNFAQKFSTRDKILNFLQPGGATVPQIMKGINEKKEGTVRTTLTRLKKGKKVNNFNEVWSLMEPESSITGGQN